MIAVSIGAAIQLVPSTKDMAVQNLPKSESELLNTVGVDDGINGGVGVREDDGGVHDEAGLLQLAVEESEAVQDVHGQPAEGEQAHDDGE